MRLWRRGSPLTAMTAALLLGLAVAAAATRLLVAQPWLGVTLEATEDGGVRLAAVAADGPAAALPIGGRVLAVAPAGAAPAAEPLALGAADVTPEPDVLPTFAAMADLFARQDALSAMLRAGPVRLLLRDDGGRETWTRVTPAAERPLADLPGVYWFQVAVGVLGLLLSCWVWALRRGDWGARMFALAGLGMLVFATAAAVYTSRSPALPGGLFRVLSDANTAGALTFGAAMIGVFLCYPRRLVPPAVLLVPMGVFGVWLVASVLHLPEGPAQGGHLATAVEMLCIVAAIGAQWWATRRDPVGRAALRWLGLSVILGAGAFVSLVSLPQLLGGEPPLEQGYAFGFFLLIHAGLALGLRRYRLFEMGEWAFRVMLATLGLGALIALDALLILALNMDRGFALGIALVIVGFLYLPLRDALWRRMVRRHRLADHELFAAVMEVAFRVSPGERAEAWRALLRRLFDPLELTAPPADAPPPEAVTVRHDGLEMLLPPVADAGPILLRLPWGGRALFAPAHRAMAVRLIELMAHAEAGRDAHAAGARAERLRIAADLHDDVGARLLGALHQPDLAGARQMIREATADIRAIVGGLNGSRMPLDHLLADLRHETARRLEAAGLALDWPLDDGAAAADLPLPYPVSRAATAVVREAVSNTLRHAEAGRVSVGVTLTDGALHLAVADDGRGLPAAVDAPAKPGSHGLAGLRRRVEEAGGTVRIDDARPGVRLAVTLPVPGAAPAAALQGAA